MKTSDFGMALGPAVVTPDELDPAGLACRLEGGGSESQGSSGSFSWPEAIALAGRRTVLRAGDVIAGPPVVVLDDVDGGVQLEVEGIGTLACPLR